MEVLKVFIFAYFIMKCETTYSHMVCVFLCNPSSELDESKGQFRDLSYKILIKSSGNTHKLPTKNTQTFSLSISTWKFKVQNKRLSATKNISYFDCNIFFQCFKKISS